MLCKERKALAVESSTEFVFSQELLFLKYTLLTVNHATVHQVGVPNSLTFYNQNELNINTKNIKLILSTHQKGC